MVGQRIADRRIDVERTAIAFEHIVVAAGAVVVTRTPGGRGADRQLAVVIIDGGVPRPLGEAEQRLGIGFGGRRFQLVIDRIIDFRTADRIVDVALHEGRVAEHAEMAQRVRKDREGDRESTSELQSLMRISYAVFCLKKKKTKTTHITKDK